MAQNQMPSINPDVCTGTDFASDYELTDRTLGSGTFSTVVTVKHKLSGEARALKRISKSVIVSPEGGLEKIEVEILLHRRCMALSDNIVQIFGVYDSPQTVDMVLESMLADDLFDAIEKTYYPSGYEEGDRDLSLECAYTEYEASKIMRQLVGAVKACHDVDVCHKDLKPENILVHGGAHRAVSLLSHCDTQSASDDHCCAQRTSLLGRSSSSVTSAQPLSAHRAQNLRLRVVPQSISRRRCCCLQATI
jgi:serine/threonine protein kinase